MDLEEIKKMLSDDEIGQEKFECIQSVPPRFRSDAFDCLEYSEDIKTMDKSWCYFLDDIIQEMTDEERIKYGFE